MADIVAESRTSILERMLIAYARRFPLRKGKLRLINALWSAAVDGDDARRIATLIYGGYRLPCDLQEDLQRQIYFFGTYFLEQDNLSWWGKQAKGAEVIFDVGANVGIFSLAALAAEPNAVVHAFEPTPEIAKRLLNAAELNGLHKLNVHALAVSNANGYAKLNRWSGDMGTNSGMNFIFGSADEGDPNRVPIVSLDDFCQEYAINRIDLLKVDVQGHEAEVFKGAQRLLTAGRIGLICFELNWARDPASICPARESIRFLERCGYRFSAVGTMLNWRKSGDWMHGLTDALAWIAPRS
jgi:FkbM family methyltransferase